MLGIANISQELKIWYQGLVLLVTEQATMTIALMSTKTKHFCQDTEAANLTHIGFPPRSVHKFSTNRKRTFMKSGPKVHFHHKMESKKGQSWYQTPYILTQTAVEATVTVLYNSTAKQTWPTQPWPWTSLQLASLQYRQTKKNPRSKVSAIARDDQRL
jgi:hypothetical protein